MDSEPAELAESSFVNEPIDVSGIPQLNNDDFEPLDANYLRLRLISDGIFAVIVIVAAIVAMFFLPFWIPLVAAAVLLLLTALAAWLQRLEVEHIGYLVRDKDFSYRNGVLTRNVATVPFTRVQHVSIDRGPIARHFGLASLHLRTAGDDIDVPGMSHETASRLKALVVDRAGASADADDAASEPDAGIESDDSIEYDDAENP